MKNGIGLYCILFTIYTIFVFSPFMLSGLNQITPVFLNLPFTVLYIHLIIIAGCILVYWGSKCCWDSYDHSLEEVEK